MRFRIRSFITAGLLYAVASWAQSTSPLDASLDAGVYTNFFFRIRYPFSASWVPQPSTSVDDTELLRQSCLGPDEVGSAKVPIYNLLTLLRVYPNHKLPARFLFVAEQLPADSGVTTSRACLEQFTARAKLEKMEPEGKIQEITLGGVEFVQQDLSAMDRSGRHITAFFTLSKGYALSFILSGPSEQVRGTMLQAMERLKFF